MHVFRYRDAVIMRYIPTVMSVDPEVVPSEVMLAWQE
jgi:hypothetical protein